MHSHFRTQSEAINQLTTWLDNQLKIWSEYENKNYIVDYFKEDYFDFKVDQFDRKKHLEVMCRTVMAKNYVFCLNLILK